MQTVLKTKIRAGKISYLNCLPFYHDLAKGSDPSEPDIEYYETYPAKINAALRQGKIDVGPISSLEYLNHQDRYLLLPDLAIGCRDFSGSVALFSREKIEHLDGALIALTRESLSSAALLKILLRHKYKFKNQYRSVESDPERMLKKYKAALVIGDQALFFRSEHFFYKYDLGELWWNWAEKPFCFSVWAVRRDYAARHSAAVKIFLEKICGNRDRHLGDLEKFVKDSMGITFLDTRFSKIYGYFFNLHYYLDRPVREGLELFYRLASRMGISPRLKRLEFFQGC